MPLYAFICETCGPFDARRPPAEASQPAQCPTCQGAGRRIYTPPGLTRTPPELRRARALEEKSAHEPEVVREPRGRPLPFRQQASGTPPWTIGH